MARSKVGIVTTSFPRFNGDPAGAFVFGLARQLARQGHSIEIVTPLPDEKPDWDDASWLEGVVVRPAGYARPPGLRRLFYGAGVPDNLSRNPWLWALVPQAIAGLTLEAVVRARNWDAMLSHWVLPSALIGGMARKKKMPHLALAHSGDIHLMGKLPFKRIVAKAVLRSADSVGFISSGLRDEFFSMLSATQVDERAWRTEITPMGVEPDEFVCSEDRDSIRAEMGLSGFVVLFVGRLVPIKGVDLLIKAVCKDTKIVVAGDGPIRSSLEELAKSQKKDVKFVGQVNPGQRARLLKACDAVVVPSRVLHDGRHEGMPLVLIEAMAAGKPVIASDTGGICEMVKDSVTGLLFRAEDIGDLGSCLRKLRDDESMAVKLATAGKKQAIERSWEKLVGRYECLLELL